MTFNILLDWVQLLLFQLPNRPKHVRNLIKLSPTAWRAPDEQNNSEVTTARRLSRLERRLTLSSPPRRCERQRPGQPVQNHHTVGHALLHPGADPPGQDELDRRDQRADGVGEFQQEGAKKINNPGGLTQSNFKATNM